ncbi:MAG: hypothetical protein GY842_23785 [bacterium]|nr:hypothetical protein [bacterium]
MKRGYLVVLTAGMLVALGATSVKAQSWTDYDDIGPDLLNWENTYPSICKRYDLGLSVGGRSLWAMRISDNVSQEEDEPEFKYVSTMHGDEIVGTKMCMMLIEEMLTNYGSDSQIDNIIDEVDLWIVPLMNPDGYDKASRTRYNNNGVDLNRNFPEGTYGDPNTTAGRAVETAVIMNWSFGESFTASANFHGGALVANYPFDNDGMGSVNSPTPYDDFFIWMSKEYTVHNTSMWNSASFQPFGITNGADWYSIDGGMQDWNYRYMGCNEITIELANTKQPSASTIPSFWSDNRDSMLACIETCLVGVRGTVIDGATGLPLDATVTIDGRSHDIFTDPDVGDYHRMTEPGTYDLTFQTAGYADLHRYGVVVTAGDATRVDVIFGGIPAVVVSPNGGEELTAGSPTTVTWTGGAANEFHVQYSDNYGAVGTETDDFEDPILGPEYTSGGNRSWFLTGSSYHSAVQSVRAGSISHSQDSWLRRTVDGGGEVSFWYRVSSEAGWDFFRFSVGGIEQFSDSGDGSWTYYSQVLGAGTWELEWKYEKDDGVSRYSDTVFIDDLSVLADGTEWTDIIALTAAGATSTPWTPPAVGTDYKVRVRAHYGAGNYGDWDESNNTFTVVGSSADGDYDDDEDVDLADFAAFQGCFGATAGSCIDVFDLVSNGVIDGADYALLVPLVTGP